MPASRSYTPHIPHLIVNALDNGDRDTARAHFDAVPASAVEYRLILELSAHAAPRPGIITLGPAILVYGHPRRPGYAWRCGDCPWTGSNYRDWNTANGDAHAHALEHPAASRPEVLPLYPGDSRHARLVIGQDPTVPAIPVADGERATVTGTVRSVLTALTKQENPWARATLIPDDRTPPLTIAVFPRLYRDSGHLLTPGQHLTADGHGTSTHGIHLIADTLTTSQPGNVRDAFTART